MIPGFRPPRPGSAVLRFVTIEALEHCFRCGLPLMPGDNAMQVEGEQRFRHYDESPRCPAAE